MAGPLDQYLRDLANRDAGWVTRRDAAEHLGALAGRALDALKKYERETDTDVQMAVEHALGVARAGLEGISPATGAGYTMADFAREIAKPPKRVVETEGNGLNVVVATPYDRSQTIHIQPFASDSGMEMIRVYTRCGKPRDESYGWALRTNLMTAQCALALAVEDGEEMYWLLNNFLAEHVTPREMKTAVKEISYYGDWIENKMTGEDKH